MITNERARDRTDANPSMVTLARTARGLTQARLAREANVSQAFLSKAEAGLVVLDGERLARVAAALGYPAVLLTSQNDEHSTRLSCVFHRKRDSLPVSIAKQIRATLEMTRLQVEPILSGLDLPVRIPQLTPSDDGYTSPADIARRVRAELAPVTGPVEQLASLLERSGAIVVRRDLGSRHIDAISEWPDRGRPIFLVSSTSPSDRTRFTLAHELGHAVMHRLPDDVNEDQADRFASEFLMPAAAIRRELSGPLSIPQLAALKQRWGVSMAALVRRARDLGGINDYQYRQLSVEFSKTGYRTHEPVDLDPEVPFLLQDTIQRRLSQGVTIPALAALARLDVAEFTALYMQEPQAA